MLKYAYRDQESENKSESNKSNPPKTQFVDSRPHALQMRNLQFKASQYSRETSPQYVDNRPEAVQMQLLQALADNSPQVKEHTQLQRMANTYSASVQPPVQRKANTRGLPHQLKSGIEHISGYAMDDVKVHYNSHKPAQLRAHAYAQGNEIHLASGQEKHLPHEAWHVVQQKQGRVKPTLQLAAQSGIPGKPGLHVKVNDDVRLEREADVMGAKALQMKPVYENHSQKQPTSSQTLPTNPATDTLQQTHSSEGVIQGAFLDIESKTLSDFVKEQTIKQKDWEKGIDTGFTTVGFEHEFVQTTGEPNELAGISHLELAKGTPLAFTKLPFVLETDAANALELVSPPYLIKTLGKTGVPDPVDVEKVDQITRRSLAQLAKSGDIGRLISNFGGEGIKFNWVPNLQIERKNVSFKSEVRDYARHPELKADSIKNIKIKSSEKNGGISSQVNFATDAFTFDAFQEINKERVLENRNGQGFDPKAIIATLEDHLKQTMSKTDLKKTKNLVVFSNQMARTLAGQFALPGINAVRKMQEEVFAGHDMHKEGKVPLFRFSAYLSSAVKDVHGVWLKDHLMNVGLGLLSPEEWQVVEDNLKAVASGVSELELPYFKNINGFENHLKKGNILIQSTLKEAKAEMINALKMISTQLSRVEKDGRKPTTKLGIVPTKEVGFMEHNEELIGPRQDTYIDPRKAQIPDAGARYHVIETRKDSLDSLYKLGLKTGQLGKEGLMRILNDGKLKYRAIEDDIKQLENKIQRVASKEKMLGVEFQSKLEELKALDKRYEEYQKSEKSQYLESEKDGKEDPQKSKKDAPRNFKKEIKKLDKLRDKTKKKLQSLEKQQKRAKLDSPIQIRNLKEKIVKHLKELDILGRELQDVEKQLSNLPKE